MNRLISKISLFIITSFAILIGLYPVAYYIQERTFGLLASKPDWLLENLAWNIFFYIHIILGGLVLMVGWSQFVPYFRKHYFSVHRAIGKFYYIGVMFSGFAGLYIAFFATGGKISQYGFFCLAIAWLYCTRRAFQCIINKEIYEHQKWMIRSYALTFAAVTLRLWLPLLIGILGLSFIEAYKIIAWLSWIPNILVAELIIYRIKKY